MFPRFLGAIVGLVVAGMVTSVNATTVSVVSTINGIWCDGCGGPLDGTPEAQNSDNPWVEYNSAWNPNGRPTQDQRAIIEFDISGITNLVSEATVTLTRFDSYPTGGGPFLSEHTIEVYGYTGNGSFDAADFSAGNLITSFSYFDAATVSFDVTSFLESQISLNDPAHFAGMTLRLASQTSARERFAFCGDTNPTSLCPAKPLLQATVASIPLPAAFPLFAGGLGLIGLIGWRRRQRSNP